MSYNEFLKLLSCIQDDKTKAELIKDYLAKSYSLQIKILERK